MKFQMLIRFILLFFCLSMMITSAKADDMKTGIEWYQKKLFGFKRLTDVSSYWLTCTEPESLH